jgi:large subunit ribosomal protein L5
MFLDRLVAVALPRMKDFRGVNRKGFDGRGNFNFGLDEQLIFTEVDYDSIMQIHGMNITMVTTTDSDAQSLKLLELMGVPFTKGHTNG